MKKKGLIVATIVMVLVLAVSLTTATYAWFSAQSRATISKIGIGTTSASEVTIGLSHTGELITSSVSASDYVYGDVTFANKQVDSESVGFGPSITITNFDLQGLTKAVGTGTVSDDTVTAIDDSWTDGHALIAANQDTSITSGNVANVSGATPAIANTSTSGSGTSATVTNGDYIDWVLGFNTTKDNIHSITLNITVNPTNTNMPTLGILAALTVRISLDGSSYTMYDLYGSANSMTSTRATSLSVATITDSTTFSSSNVTVERKYTKADQSSNNNINTWVNTNADSQALNAGAANFAITFTAGSNASDVFAVNTIKQLALQIFYNGYDDDCRTSALGQTADIYFTVTDTTYSA